MNKNGSDCVYCNSIGIRKRRKKAFAVYRSYVPGPCDCRYLCAGNSADPVVLGVRNKNATVSIYGYSECTSKPRITPKAIFITSSRTRHIVYISIGRKIPNSTAIRSSNVSTWQHIQ